MKIVKESIAVSELQEMSKMMFGNFVKAVVDVEKEIMAVDADLHADEEALLLENGSRQEVLWGINFYPELSGDDFIEFDSMINVRPSQGNRSRGVDDIKIQQEIRRIIGKLVKQ